MHGLHALVNPSELPAVVARVLGVPEAEVAPGTRLQRDLGLDAYDLAELLDELERALGVTLPPLPPPEWRTIADLMRCVGPRPTRRSPER